MRKNVEAFYRKLPHEVSRLPPKEIKEAFVTIVYYNKKVREQNNG